MGHDGHTASLFPGYSSLRERTRLVVATFVPKLDTHRITLTLPVLNHAANVLFVVAGAEKAHAVSQVFASRSAHAELPAAMVRPTRGKLVWLLDREAAATLPPDA
jgi:6-phosphogluconolactonase